MDICSCVECTIPNEWSCGLCILGDYDVVSGRFIASNKCTSLAGDVHGGGCYCMEQGMFGKSLHLPLNFVLNLKCMRKKNLNYKN